MKLKSAKLMKILLGLSVIPVLLMGIIVVGISSELIYNSLKAGVLKQLDILAQSSYQIMDLIYPGDFEVRDKQIYKGNISLEGHFELVEDIADRYGADASLFLGNTRYLTTVMNPDGTKAIGTKVAPKVEEYVLNRGQEYFSDEIQVNENLYFGYYIPIRDSGKKVIGMLFVGTPRKEVIKDINKVILLVGGSAALVMAVVIVITVLYSRRMVYSLHKIQNFLGKIAGGDTKAEIDPYLLARHDEIGEMGRFAVMLQSSITDLVGKDPLTSLYNRRCGNIMLENQAERVILKNAPFTIAMGDIDLFKKINDTYGHPAGDEVLKHTASVMQKQMECLGFVFRWGGEEFLLLFEGKSKEEAYSCLCELKESVEGSETFGEGYQIKITMTFGMADFGEESNIEKLLQLADERMYRGKQAGRNCVVK